MPVRWMSALGHKRTYIYAFMVLGFAVIGALLLMLLLRDPPAHLDQTAARK